jgi:hypothetical protein
MGLVRLREAEHGICLTEQIAGHAGLGEDAHGPRKLAGVLFDVVEVGVKACKYEDSAVGQFAAEVSDEIQAVPAGHDKIAEEQIGTELPSAEKALIRGVAGSRLVTSLFEDQGEGICDHGVVVHD